MPEKRTNVLAAWVLCLLGLLPAIGAVVQLGRLHPDEVYQLLEPAYRAAHGYGIQAWEWKAGLRNWVFPGLASILLKAAAAVGMDHPLAYRALLAVPQAALHVASVFAVRRFLRRYLDAAWASAWAGAAIYAVYGLVLLFAGRTLSESFSASFLVLAMVRLDGTDRSRQGLVDGIWGGAWLGLAVVARYGSGVIVLAALGVLGLQRRWWALAGTCAGGLVVGLGLAGVDAWTWGKPFHSLLTYVDFNVLSGKAAHYFGVSPWTFYLPPLGMLVPLWVWPGLVATVRLPSPRAVLPLVCAAAYLAALFVTPHKEERFLYPGLVLLLLAGLPGWLHVLGQLASLPLRAAVLGATAVLGLLTAALYPQDLRGDEFRAIVRATRGNATGLLIVNEGVWGSGGYFYVGRPIPWWTCDWPADPPFQRAMRDPRINRAVTFEGRALDALLQHGFRVTGTEGRETLLER